MGYWAGGSMKRRILTGLLLPFLAAIALLWRLARTVIHLGFTAVPNEMAHEWRSVVASAIYVATGVEKRFYNGAWRTLEEISAARRQHFTGTVRRQASTD